MSGDELGEEISGLGLLGVLEVIHYVSLLLPDFNSLLQFHLTLITHIISHFKPDQLEYERKLKSHYYATKQSIIEGRFGSKF